MGDDPVFNDENYTHVATVECESLAHAFQLTNHISHDWTTNKEVIWRKGSGANTRSTSCGDVLIVNGKKYKVCFVGFEELT